MAQTIVAIPPQHTSTRQALENLMAMRISEEYEAAYQLVASLDDEITEDDFTALCARSGVENPEVVFWVVDHLGLIGMRAD